MDDIYLIDGQQLDPELRPQGATLELQCPIAGPVSMADLLRFAAIMQMEGRAVQAARMLYDRPYALQQLALGQQAVSSTLRGLTQELFDRYQRGGEWIGLAH